MKLLTLARDLKRRKARERRDLFVSEGIRCVEELLRSPLEIEGVLILPGSGNARVDALATALRGRGVDVEEVSAAGFDSAAGTESPQGVLAIARVPKVSPERAFQAAGERLRAVVLDGVQDPGNVGTILRTAAALGACATLALPGTADLWNAKVVRGAMGAHFRHAAASVTPEELAALLRSEGVELWAADAKGDPLAGLSAPGRLAIAVGNEGAGLSAAVRGLAQRTVSLPIQPGVESLNVAVATGIILYELSE